MGQVRVDTCGWGGAQLHVDVHRKIRTHLRHSVFFSSKEVDFLNQNFVFGRYKKGTFFVNINYQ